MHREHAGPKHQSTGVERIEPGNVHQHGGERAGQARELLHRSSRMILEGNAESGPRGYAAAQTVRIPEPPFAQAAMQKDVAFRTPEDSSVLGEFSAEVGSNLRRIEPGVPSDLAPGLFELGPKRARWTTYGAELSCRRNRR